MRTLIIILAALTIGPSTVVPESESKPPVITRPMKIGYDHP